jgi:hypothetical protein
MHAIRRGARARRGGRSADGEWDEVCESWRELSRGRAHPSLSRGWRVVGRFERRRRMPRGGPSPRPLSRKRESGENFAPDQAGPGAGCRPPHPQPFPHKPRGGREPVWCVAITPGNATRRHPEAQARRTRSQHTPRGPKERAAAARMRGPRLPRGGRVAGRSDERRRMPRVAPPPAPPRTLRMRRGETSIAVRLASCTRLRLQSAKADFGPLLPRLQSPQQSRVCDIPPSWRRIPSAAIACGAEESVARGSRRRPVTRATHPSNCASTAYG